MRLAGSLAIALVLASAAGARADIERNQFSDREWKVEQLVVPRDWQLTEHRGYPGVLVWAVHREGRGSITLAAEHVAGDVEPREYAEKTRAILARVGYQVGRVAPHPSGGYLIEATAPDRRTRLRQGTRVEGGIAYIVTLATPIAAMTSHARAFDDILGHLRVASPRAEPPQEEATSQPVTP